MDGRRKKLLNGISREMRGLEIAPWFAPIAPKAEGFNVKILDFFPKSELVPRAIADPNVPIGAERNIEDVDFVGNASDIGRIVTGEYDYLISSHNFEHLPDPIRFLQGAESLLAEGGKLIMALPDCRYTFDRFRTHTLFGEWLAAYKEQRAEPTPKQIFEFYAYMSSNLRKKLFGDLIEANSSWDRDVYTDVHCTTFFPASFELLILEARALGLTRFNICKISQQYGEFFVWLEVMESEIIKLNENRERLLFRIKNESNYPPSLRTKIFGAWNMMYDKLTT